MDLQTIGEIVLGLLTAVLGGTGVTTHVKHKNRSRDLEEQFQHFKEKTKVKLAILHEAKGTYEESLREIKGDLKYIRKKLENKK